MQVVLVAAPGVQQGTGGTAAAAAAAAAKLAAASVLAAHSWCGRRGGGGDPGVGGPLALPGALPRPQHQTGRDTGSPGLVLKGGIPRYLLR